MNCSIFLQDKYKYISALAASQLSIPTFYVDFLEYANNKAVFSAKLAPWMEITGVNESTEKWVIKSPWCTHNEGMRFGSSLDEVLEKIQLNYEIYYTRERESTRENCNFLSYAMVQPRLSNRLEYKVVLRNGKACYITMQKEKGAGSKAFALRRSSTGNFLIRDNILLFKFAENALQE